MRLVVVTGVGTDIGKTHVAVALLGAWTKLAPVVGHKPVESGVSGAVGPDEAALQAASTFHVKPPLVTLRLRRGVSPHLAARVEGRAMSLDAIAEGIRAARQAVDLVVELPGGLFTPLTDESTNLDLAARLLPDVVLLVAPDRLGVLHDVGAVQAACRGRLRVDGVVLSAPAVPDASSGTNAAELTRVFGVPVLASLRRAPVDDLVQSRDLSRLVAFCRGTAEDPPLE